MTPAGLIRMKLAEEFAQKACQEWSAMYHNASLQDFPYDNDEAEDFGYWLYDCCVDLCNDLKDQINEKWGFKWSFYQYGRSGATIAPAEVKSMDRYFNRNLEPNDLWNEDLIPFDFEYDAPDMGDEEARYCAESAKAYLEAFQYVNKTVREAVKNIPAVWKEYQAYQGELREAM